MDRTVYYNTESCSTNSDDSYQSSVASSRDRSSKEQIYMNNVFQMRQRRDSRNTLTGRGQKQQQSNDPKRNYNNMKADATSRDINKPQHHYSIPNSHAAGEGARHIFYKNTGGSAGGITRKVLQSGISRVAVPCHKDREDIEFQYCTVLVLHLQCKNIRTMTPGALDQFGSLKNLYLYKNNIRRIQGLEALSNLELLDLSRNNVERIDNLDKCQKLKKLYLGFNEIQIIEGLEGLVNLEELHIDDQDVPPEQPIIFSPGIMASVAQCLFILDLSSNQLVSLDPIAGLPMLRTLLAADNKFSDFDQILGTLESLRQLHVLTLKGNPIAKKPNYKAKVIGSVYSLEILDDKEINDTTRASVQKLRFMKEYRARQRKEAELQNKMKKAQEEENNRYFNSHHLDLGNAAGDFSFSTPTRLSPLMPSPRIIRSNKSSLPYGSSSRTPEVSESEDSQSISNIVIDSSSYNSRARNPADDEFLLEIEGGEEEQMSDMAKIIFRLSNMDEVGASGDVGANPVKMKHSNYWEFPGSSLPPSCRPLSPLEDSGHTQTSASTPKNKAPIQSASTPVVLGHSEKKSGSGHGPVRPKPAAPGGRHRSNNTTSKPGQVSSVDFTILSSSSGSHQQQQPVQQLSSSSQRHFYGRTLSPLMEMPTPESLTARDENNE